MQIVSKPFGEKGISLLSGRFKYARALLTTIYTIIVGIILLVSTTATYSAFGIRLQQRFRTPIPPRLEVQIAQRTTPRAEEVLEDLLRSSIATNIALLISAAMLSYWFAGLTLEPIQAAYDRQRQFLSDASHELRTPLAILQTDLELQRQTANTAQRERIAEQLQEVQRMSQLVEDLLLLSRLEEPQVRPTQHVQVADVLQNVAHRLETFAVKHQVTVQLGTLSPAIVNIHPEHLNQAISNLVKNAIIYNKPQGTVTLSCEKQKKHVHIHIADSGVGMSQEELHRLSERFYRTDSSRSRSTGGSGLGISIAQTIITQAHGNLHVESIPQQGTEFIIELPTTSSQDHKNSANPSVEKAS